MNYLKYVKYAKYGKYVMFPVVWYSIGCCNKEIIKDKMYNKGFNLSQTMKIYSVWDRYAEPFFIKQFSIMFTAGHSFLEGMISDNDDKDSIKQEMDNMYKEIKELIEERDKDKDKERDKDKDKERDKEKDKGKDEEKDKEKDKGKDKDINL